MKRQTLITAINEAEAFLSVAREAHAIDARLRAENENGLGPDLQVNNQRLRGKLRRAALELRYTLADLRSGR